MKKLIVFLCGLTVLGVLAVASGCGAGTPNDDDAFALLKLYPPIDQID
ncbi:MAG: hypothetical protein GX604_08905 [Actinobacteria bacterium]|nr:hypothetical protein [Actinomycetota bacterium]